MWHLAPCATFSTGTLARCLLRAASIRPKQAYNPFIRTCIVHLAFRIAKSVSRINPSVVMGYLYSTELENCVGTHNVPSMRPIPILHLRVQRECSLPSWLSTVQVPCSSGMPTMPPLLKQCACPVTQPCVRYCHITH